MKIINNKRVTLELTKSFYTYGFYPQLGINFVFYWRKPDRQFGLYLYLLLFNIYFDWFIDEVLV